MKSRILTAYCDIKKGQAVVVQDHDLSVRPYVEPVEEYLFAVQFEHSDIPRLTKNYFTGPQELLDTMTCKVQNFICLPWTKRIRE